MKPSNQHEAMVVAEALPQQPRIPYT